MRNVMIALTAASALVPAVMPSAADAQQWRRYNHNWNQVRNYDYNRYEPGYNAYYPERYYRPGRVYTLQRGDRIYRGHDGRYYCRRSDGTTGLIIGGAIGALLGNQLRIGGSETLSTILGGAAGAAIGQRVARGKLRCR